LPASLNEQTPIEAEAEPPRASARDRLEAAHRRLRGALDALDSAVIRQNERALGQADQNAEFSALQDDRSRLAVELEAASRRLKALEAANGEAARRIERASAAVRAVLAADSAGEG
jgi:hypothetical protein